MPQILGTVKQQPPLVTIQDLGSKQGSLTNPHKITEINLSNIQRQTNPHKFLPDSLNRVRLKTSKYNGILATFLFLQLSQFNTYLLPRNPCSMGIRPHRRHNMCNTTTR
jgi:hypothetical protein